MIAASIVCGVVSVVSFLLYVRYRMRPGAELQEQRYQQIHFISLALFVLFGVLILVDLSHRYNPPRITY